MHKVAIIGGGFGGLYAAKALSSTGFAVTLIDKRNFHLFQPLLYQVATGGLSPGDIAAPYRSVLGRLKNVSVLMAEVTDIDLESKRVLYEGGSTEFDSIVIATGVTHSYFGREDWAQRAPGLKTVEDALKIRRMLLAAFEKAELLSDDESRKEWLRFVIVGGGPTGVELAGALGELAHSTLTGEFRNYRPEDAEIILVEAGERILPSYDARLSEKATRSLQSLGVTVMADCLCEDINGNAVWLKKNEVRQVIKARTVLWAAGVQASPVASIFAAKFGAQTDHAGRISVRPELSIPGHSYAFVIGDLAALSEHSGKPLPGVAPVAMQQARYVAKLLKNRLRGETLPPFRYRNKGSLAVIGRNRAVAEVGQIKLSGFPAWVIWAFVHISYLIGFKNKLLVMLQWGWSYITHNRGALLIQGGEYSDS